MSITFESLAALPDDSSAVLVRTSLGEVALTVTQAVAAPAGRPGGSVLLTGPTEPALAQGTYPVRVGTDEDLLFVVPVGTDATGTTYEAVFA